jgi:polysaccharide deacetylase 2 family uncharacterized protein YibQ
MKRRALIAGLVLTAAGTQLVRAAGDPAEPEWIGTAGIAPGKDTLVPESAPALAATNTASTASSVPATVAASGTPRWQRLAVAPPNAAGRPIITLVIDDMGVMHPGTNRAMALPGPITLSWFPFAPKLTEQAAEGASHGHETLLHMPMQSFGNGILQTGPDPLRIDLPAEVNLARLRTALDAIPTAVGLNNHMGSVATRDVALMDLVAKETRARDMLFMDSLTINHSVALQQARVNQVPSIARDLFVDNSSSPAMIEASLALVESEARSHGRVVAIAHPRPHTLNALEAWMPQLESRGFALWPLSAMVALENGIQMPAKG